VFYWFDPELCGGLALCEIFRRVTGRNRVLLTSKRLTYLLPQHRTVIKRRQVAEKGSFIPSLSKIHSTPPVKQHGTKSLS
jgi:hypothetical protein